MSPYSERFLFAQLFHFLSDPVFVVNEKNKILICNDACVETYGYTKKEFVDLNPEQVIHPDYYNKFQTTLSKTVLSATQLEESVHIRKDGNLFPVEVHSRAEVYGDETGLIVVVRDITERKRTEEALQASEERYKTLSDVTTEGIIIHDNGIVIDVNERFVNMFGYSDSSELIGENAVELLVPSPEERERMNKKIQTGNLGPYEINTKRVDGTIFPIEVRAAYSKVGGKEVRVASAFDISERKKAEEEFEDIFNLSPDICCVFSDEGKLLKVNTTWQKLLGYTKDEVLQKNWTDFVHPDDMEDTRKQSASQTSGSIKANIVNRYKHKDGSYRLLEWQATDAKEGIILGTARDITERKQAEDMLKKSEEQFRSLTTASPVGVYQTDVEGNCVYTNKKWREMAGLSEKEALGQGWTQGLHPDDRDRVFTNWQRMVESEGDWGFEYRFQTPDGRTTWVFGQAGPIRDTDGKIVGYIGANSDITERKIAEEDLKVTEQNPKNLMAGIPIGVSISNPEGQVVEINDYAVEMFGYDSKENLMSVPAAAHYYNPKDREQFTELIKEGSVRDLELKLKRKDGSSFLCSVSSVLKENQDGTIQYINAFQDITEKQKTEGEG